MNLKFQWLLSQIGGVGTLQGSSGTMKRILTQVDTAGGQIWLDDELVTIAAAELALGDQWEDTADQKLIIVGDETSNDPALPQSIIIKFVV